MTRIAVIINPIAGGGRRDVAAARAEQASALLAARGLDAEIVLTERSGHARELAESVLHRGATTVVAWGGDGTVNEVASVLAFRNATLAIVPSGSGNGLARELGIPLDTGRAFAAALDGRDIVMDAGELDGHLFFNVAGIGLDARVAHRFSSGGLVRRGFLRYLALTTREIFTYEPDEHTIVLDGEPMRSRALLVAIANSRQYGNGAIIAPGARIDDGRLDVIVVQARSPLRTLVQVPRIFTGQIAKVPDVTIRTATEIEVTSARPVIFHVDGEPYVGGAVVRARVHPAALRIRTPGP